MSESPTARYITPEEYLLFEEHSPTKHEYVDGRVFAMTGATEAHNIICMNLATKIHSRLKGTGCRAYANVMKVRVEAANSFYYPDIMVTCEPIEAASVFKCAPRLIIEVLSRSTSRIDRTEKLVAYRQLDSLSEYVIVHQKKMLVEKYSKRSDGVWELTSLKKGDKLSLKSIPGKPLNIALSDIYESLDPPSVVKESEEDYYVEYDEEGEEEFEPA
jgi:Uma2 family endonuclease